LEHCLQQDVTGGKCGELFQFVYPPREEILHDLRRGSHKNLTTVWYNEAQY